MTNEAKHPKYNLYYIHKNKSDVLNIIHYILNIYTLIFIFYYKSQKIKQKCQVFFLTPC